MEKPLANPTIEKKHNLNTSPAVSGKIKSPMCYMSACRQGTRKLGTNAKEATQGFPLIHLIDDLLLKQGGGGGYINSNPVSGQATWYDFRAKIEKAPKGAINTELLFNVLMPPKSISGRS